MSDSWHRRYHREKLEAATGQKWYPSSRSVNRCSRDLVMARRALASLRSIEQLIVLTQVCCVALVVTGIAVGVCGVFRTVGPTTAFILPSVVTFLAGIGLRIPFTLYAVRPAELAVVDAEEAYDTALMKEIAS